MGSRDHVRVRTSASRQRTTRRDEGKTMVAAKRAIALLRLRVASASALHASSRVTLLLDHATRREPRLRHAQPPLKLLDALPLSSPLLPVAPARAVLPPASYQPRRPPSSFLFTSLAIHCLSNFHDHPPLTPHNASYHEREPAPASSTTSTPNVLQGCFPKGCRCTSSTSSIPTLLSNSISLVAVLVPQIAQQTISSPSLSSTHTTR